MNMNYLILNNICMYLEDEAATENERVRLINLVKRRLSDVLKTLVIRTNYLGKLKREGLLHTNK